MKWLILLFFTFLISNQPLPEQMDIFKQANSAYAAGDYLKAAILYESLAKADKNAVNLYFNLGNAYFELGDLGRALLNYRRGYELAPRDGQLNENLTAVRVKRVDLQGDETDFIIGFSTITSGLFSLPELNGAVWLVGILAACLISLAVVRPARGRRLKLAIVSCVVFLTFGLVLLISRVVVNMVRPTAVVIVSTGQVMSGPGDQYMEIFRVHAATEVRIVTAQNHWLRFQLPDGRGGWIREEGLEKINS